MIRAITANAKNRGCQELIKISVIGGRGTLAYSGASDQLS
jgi:hypothetical protein